VLRTAPISCPLRAARIELQVVLASGRMFEATTDERGRFAFVMRDDTDRVFAVSTKVRPPVVERELAPPAPQPPPSQPPPPQPPPPNQPPSATTSPRTGMAAVGRVAIACAAKLGLDGIAKLELAIGRDGAITKVDTDRDVAFTECVRRGLVDVTFPPNSTGTLTVPLLLKRRP
jgi:hypothetical protein